MTDLRVFRIYEPHELGRGGYPVAWDRLTDPEHSELLDAADLVLPGGVKDVVRAFAGDRCERCGHPYLVGRSGEWAKPPRVLEQLERERTGEVQGSLLAIPQPEGLPAAVVREARARRLEVLYSACDARCDHGGPARYRAAASPWQEVGDSDFGVSPLIAAGLDVQAEYRILTVHHLNGRKFDLRWWNLVALCQRCHLYIQRKVQMERVYPFEHTPWFQPYAAGFYAASYLGENLTREQTMERLPELLALERAA